MARPRARGEVKTGTINIRVTPSLKAKLEAHAKIAGRTLSAECEERLLHSMIETEARASADTEELLTEIKRLIGEIEEVTGTEETNKANGRHGWRKGLATWAAVAEMLATGPIMQRVPPELTESDKLLEQRYRDLIAAKEERDRIASMIALMGIVSLQLAPTLGVIMPNRDDLRENVRTRLPEHLQENAEALIAKLEELDTRETQLMEEIRGIVEPYREAIDRGRKLYDQPKKGLALSAALARPRQTNALASFPPISSDGIINALLHPPGESPLPVMFPPMTVPKADTTPEAE